MSYILSALRKAEQDRRQGQPASGGLAGLVAAGPDVVPGRTRPLVLLVGVLGVVIAAGIWLWPGAGGERGAVVDRLQPAVEEPPPPIPSPAPTAATQGAPVVAAVESPPPQPVAPAPVEAMPRLNITGYIFFEANPERSKLFVDGVVYRHQSRLREGMTLEAFYPDGVLISYRGQTHRVAVP